MAIEESVHLFPSEALLIGRFQGEYQVEAKRRRHVRFVDSVLNRLHRFVPRAQRAFVSEQSGETFFDFSRLQLPDLLFHHLRDVCQVYEFDLMDYGSSKEEYELGAAVIRRAIESAIEVVEDGEAELMVPSQIEDSPGREDAKVIHARLSDLMQRSNCEAEFAFGWHIGAAAGACSLMDDSVLSDLLPLDDALSSRFAKVKSLSGNATRWERFGATLGKLLNDIWCHDFVRNEPLFDSLFQDHCWQLEMSSDDESETELDVPTRPELVELAGCIRRDIEFVFGFVLGNARREEHRQPERREHLLLNRAFHVKPTSSRLQIAEMLKLAEAMIDGRVSVSPETFVTAIKDSVEALVRQVFKAEFVDAPKTADITEVLRRQSRGGSQLEKRFSSLALNQYHHLRNQSSHQFGTGFICNWNEALSLYCAIRALTQRADEIDAERARAS